MAMAIIDGYIVGGTNEPTVADQYNEEREWVVGEYCIYNSTVYKCNTNTTGEFDSTAWDATSCGAELTALNSDLTQLSNAYNSRINLVTITKTTGSGGSAGVIEISKSDYPNMKTLIPFGYSYDSSYKIGLLADTANKISIGVQNAANNTWASGANVTFYAYIIY